MVMPFTMAETLRAAAPRAWRSSGRRQPDPAWRSRPVPKTGATADGLRARSASPRAAGRLRVRAGRAPASCVAPSRPRLGAAAPDLEDRHGIAQRGELRERLGDARSPSPSAPTARAEVVRPSTDGYEQLVRDKRVVRATYVLAVCGS